MDCNHSVKAEDHLPKKDNFIVDLEKKCGIFSFMYGGKRSVVADFGETEQSNYIIIMLLKGYFTRVEYTFTIETYISTYN